MIGYGFLNSKVHLLCVRGVIDSFFNRTLFTLPFFYYSIYKKKPDIDSLTFEDIKNLFIIFILEEKKINNSDEPIYKYILSSNVAKNKDYKFRDKQIQEVLNEGSVNLKDIFLETFKIFLKKQIVKQIFLDNKEDLSLDSFDLKKEVGDYFPDPSDDKDSAESSNIKNKNYKDLYEKLQALYNAMRGIGTDNDLVKKTITSMTPQQKCYVCTRLGNFGANGGTSMMAKLEDELNDLLSDKRDEYLYSPLNCQEFGFAKKEGGNGLGKCKTYFSISKFKRRYKLANSKGNVSTDENENLFEQSFNKFFIEQKNYIINYDAIYQFYKNNNLLLTRDTYLNILTKQINVLET